MSSAAIKNYGGVPTLFIDGEPQVEMAYMTYFDEVGTFGDFYQAGYRCFCLCVYFGDQSIKPSNVYSAFAPGIFSEKGKAGFSHLEKIVANLLRQAPDAKIFFRVNTAVPRWWEEENTAELNDSGVENQPPRSCVAGVVGVLLWNVPFFYLEKNIDRRLLLMRNMSLCGRVKFHISISKNMPRSHQVRTMVTKPYKIWHRALFDAIDTISKNLKEAVSDTFPKVYWLVKYHNDFCRKNHCDEFIISQDVIMQKQKEIKKLSKR